MKQVLNTKTLLVLSPSLLHSIEPLLKFLNYRLILLLTCTTLFVSSCKKEDKVCKKTLPFTAVIQIQSVVTQQGPPTLIEATGTGDGTPIGKLSFVGHAKVDANNNFTDDGTLTGANGDQIFETATGPGPVVDPATGNFFIISHNIITGGTGRFEGATGSYTTIAHGSFFSPAGVDSLKGTITLDECHVNK